MRSRSAFTLVEMLIVLGLVAVLSVVLIVTLNPSELLNQAKDSTRLQNLDQLHSAVKFFTYDSPNGNIGSSSVVYVSLVDPSTTSTAGSDCGSLGLLNLPNPWVYHCAASSTYRKTDGTGWVPINFQATPSGNNLEALPIDPVNSSSTRYFYTYQISGQNWEFDARLKSTKYGAKATVDGGDAPLVYERGSLLTVAPASGALMDPVPYATTTAASNATDTAATLNGQVDPDSATTTVWFEYGPTTSFGSSTANQTVTSTATSTGISANLTGLVASATYYFRVDAQNSYGTTNGNTLNFITTLTPVLTYSGTTSGSRNMSASGTLGFTVAGSWTMTVNKAVSVTVKGIAGGGQGGGSSIGDYDSGSGGGGGAINSTGVVVTLLPGTTYAAVVGAGGNAGSNSGASGQNTKFQVQSGTVYLELGGGTGGPHGYTSAVSGGSPVTGGGSAGGNGGAAANGSSDGTGAWGGSGTGGTTTPGGGGGGGAGSDGTPTVGCGGQGGGNTSGITCGSPGQGGYGNRGVGIIMNGFPEAGYGGAGLGGTNQASTPGGPGASGVLVLVF